MQSTFVWIDEWVATASPADERDAIVGFMDGMSSHVTATFAEMFRPNEAMQDLLRVVVGLFDPLRQQIIDAVSAGVEDFDIEMPAGFVGLVRAMADTFEQECPDNWPPSLWLQAADAVVRHGVPIVGIIPSDVVGRVVTAAEHGQDPFAVLADSREEVLRSVSEFAADAYLRAARPDIVEELTEVVDLIGDGRYASAIRTSFAVIDALLFKRELATYAEYREAQVASLDDVKLLGLRGTLVRHCLAPFYENHQIGAGTTPNRLNRHAVMHGIDRQHATNSNAVTACLLAATLVDAQNRSGDLADDGAGDDG